MEEKILGVFNIVCVTKFLGEHNAIWHIQETGQAEVVQRTVASDFSTWKNKDYEHELGGLTYTIVKFQGQEYLLTKVLDGLDSMAVCLLVKPLSNVGNRLKLYTDTPTPEGKTKEAVRENARLTIESRRRRW